MCDAFVCVFDPPLCTRSRRQFTVQRVLHRTGFTLDFHICQPVQVEEPASQLDHMGEYFSNSVELSLLFLTVWPVSTHTYIEHCGALLEEDYLW